MNRKWVLAALIAAAGCNDDDVVEVPEDPDPVGHSWSCTGTVEYLWCFSGGGAACTIDASEENATVSVDGCLESTSSTFPQAEADAACHQACLDAVEAQAAGIGQDEIENIQGCEDLVAYGWGACELPSESEAPVELVYTDPAGRSTRATGSVAYTLDAATRTGRAGRITGIQLDVPLTYTVAERHVSILTGYPVGTTVEVFEVGLGHGVPLQLDAAGGGRIAAGVPVTAVVTVTEPQGLGDTRQVWAALPWDLTLIATETTLAVDPWSDGLGGRFEVR